METLKYKIIKNESQYMKYCSILESLLDNQHSDRDEIELLTLLIEKWDEDHNTFSHSDPVELLRALMNDQDMKTKDLVSLLGVSKGLVSDIMNYKKGMSKEVIRKLSSYFKISQEAFNQPYKLNLKTSVKNAVVK